MPLPNSGAALFAGSAQEFMVLAPASRLTAHITHEFNRRWGTATESEVRSWKNSLAALAGVVKRADIEHSGVGVELKLPSTSKRVDVSLVGRDRVGQPRVLLVELKQWESASASRFPDNVVVGTMEHLHPSVQAGAYADYLRDSHSAFTEHGYLLDACAYLHNMPAAIAAELRSEAYREALDCAPMFSRGDEPEFGELLSTTVGAGGGMELLPALVNGRYSPSKRLIEGIAQSLSEAPAWTLLDEQRLTFNIVRGLVEEAASGGGKQVVVVMGGPGTGKSVVAAHLVVALSRDGGRVVHATGSKAFTTNLRAIGPTDSSAVFRYFNNFREKQTDADSFDVIVCDEAHRLRDTSNDRFTKKALQSEISQTREIIRAGRVTVFFLDERQNVRPDEQGTVDEIREAAIEEGAGVRKLELTGQFRCSGSSAYVDWVDALMSPAPQPAGGWLASGEYALQVFDDPASMERALRESVGSGQTGRMVAGFCWPWSDPRPDGSLVPDVIVGEWRRPWNEKSPEQQKPPKPQPPPKRHPYYLWATQPERIGEIGCIYSAQGFEFDYCGVILGDDLVWRDGEGWVGRKERSFDSAIKRRRYEPADLARLLQHTYRVLLTRGIRGTFVYSTDEETRAFLRRLTQ